MSRHVINAIHKVEIFAECPVRAAHGLREGRTAHQLLTPKRLPAASVRGPVKKNQGDTANEERDNWRAGNGLQTSKISVGPKKQNVMKIGQIRKQVCVRIGWLVTDLGKCSHVWNEKKKKADRGVHGKVGGCVRKTVLRKVVVGPRCVFL